MSMSCVVDSYPGSFINITYNIDKLLVSDMGYLLDYGFAEAKCLDTGNYTCTADNGIGNGEMADLYLNILCEHYLFHINPI